MSERSKLARTVMARSNAVARCERAAYRHSNQSAVSLRKLHDARAAYRAAWEALNTYDKEHDNAEIV